jgi:prevent-host-death family protein
MTITATKLRADLYRVIGDVIEKGVSVEVELRGRKVRIVPAEPRDKLAALVKRPGIIVGDPRRLPRINTFDEKKWRQKWDKRLK